MGEFQEAGGRVLAQAPLLQFSITCSRNSLPISEQPQLGYFLVELAPQPAAEGRRLPLNFALILDHSGSMAGEKLRMMKEAVKSIIDQLEPQDIISIVLFESRSRVLVSASRANDREKLKQAVDQIREAGGTSLAPALRAGLQLVGQHHSPDRISRLILLTDGEVTDDPAESRLLAEEAGRLGIPIISLGFGKDWNERFLFDLADLSIRAPAGSHQGLADYIPSPQHIVEIFQQVFRSMQVMARDVMLTLRMVQGMEARRVWQVHPLIRDISLKTIQGRAVCIEIGQLEQMGNAYLLELMLPPRPAGNYRLLQGEVVYQTALTGAGRQTVDVLLSYCSAADEALNGRVMNVVEKVQAFRLQTQALDEAEVGRVEAATQKLRQAVTILLAQGETELAQQMQTEVERLEAQGQISSEGKKTILLTSRKTVRMSDLEDLP